MYPLVKITINLPLCDMEVLPVFTAYLQQTLPALESVSSLVEVTITGCCEGCEGFSATGEDKVIMAEAEPQEQHVVHHVYVPEQYQYEDYDEDGDAIQEHGVDPYELPDLTDPEYDSVGQRQESQAEHEMSCIDENAFCLKC